MILLYLIYQFGITKFVSSLLPIQIILVCQGAEYKAVCQGLSCIPDPKPVVVPMPLGTKAVLQYLAKWQAESFLEPPKVLVMGLCGSLNPLYRIGDIVLYQNCVYQGMELEPQILPCDPSLTNTIYTHCQEKIALVTAVTSDDFIYSAAQKRSLRQTSKADVVDMEGASILKALIPGATVSMLRVISDNCDRDLPNLATAVSPEGSLQTIPLAIAMSRQPFAATRLIRGSLRGLKVLQKVSTTLFST